MSWAKRPRAWYYMPLTLNRRAARALPAACDKRNIMRDKLEKIIEGYTELQAKLGDPAVLADQKEYARLSKEYSNQGPLVAKAREYIQACDDIDDAKEMLADPDMKEFAQETIAAA